MKLEKALKILKALLEADKDGYGFSSGMIKYLDKKNCVIVLKTGGFFEEHIEIIGETIGAYSNVTFRFSDDGDKLVIYHEKLSIPRWVFG